MHTPHKLFSIQKSAIHDIVGRKSNIDYKHAIYGKHKIKQENNKLSQ